MSNTAQNTTLIEPHVPDFDPVKKYYGELGFQVIREVKPAENRGYLGLRMQDNILYFWAGNEHVYEQSCFSRFPRDTPRGYAVQIVLMVKEAVMAL